MKSIISLFGVAGLASAWWDGPHVLSAEIAARHLTALGREDVLKTVNRVFYAGADIWPCHAELQSSATWLDYVKNRRRTSDTSTHPAKPELGYLFLDHLRMWDRFHYYDALYVDEEGVEKLKWTSDWAQEALQNLDAHYLQNQTLNTILTAMGNAETALWGGKVTAEDKTPWSMGVNLHHVTHLLGDLHMPCHTAALWNWEDHEAYGRGMHDEGANYINIRYQDDKTCPDCEKASIRNLHAFWDAMGGYETRNRFDIWGKTDAKVEEIMKEFANTTLINNGFKLADATILDVMRESFSLVAIPQERYGGFHVYKGVKFSEHFCAPEWRTQTATCIANNNCTSSMDCFSAACRKGCSGNNRFEITPEYVQFAIKASKERIALTGYRMAHNLIKAVDNMTDELKERVGVSFDFARSRQRSRNAESGCVELRQPTSGAEMNVLLSLPILIGAAFALLN